MQDKENLRYYYTPLNPDNIEDWFSVAESCSYAWQDILDRQIIDQSKNSIIKTKFIIYNTSNNDPVAIFFSEYQKTRYKKYFFRFNVKSLNTQFTGLFINDKYQKDFKKILYFTEQHIINSLRESLSIDYLIYSPSPILIILKPDSIIKQILFTNKNILKFDGIILNKLGENILSSFNRRTRYEINRGLKYFERNNLIFEHKKEKVYFSYFEKLEKYKSRKKGIPFQKEQFLNINKNGNYKFFAILNRNNEPISLAFIRVYKNIATFRYNSSSALGRENFLNKVLLYKIYNYLKDIGIEYFILGNIYDIEGIKYFKESLSNQTIINQNYITLFSIKSKILNLFKKL